MQISPMRNLLLLCASLFLHQLAQAGTKDSTIYYNMPDSVKAVQFMVEVKVESYNAKGGFRLGIETDVARLTMKPGKKEGAFIFYPGGGLRNLNYGSGTSFDLKEYGITFKYDWRINETYKLLISQATDSAGNFSIYSGYVFLPREDKWKFIGSGKVEGKWSRIQKPAFTYMSGKKQNVAYHIGEVWCQRQNDSWINLKEENQPAPVINLMGHIDSVSQRQTDIKIINDAIPSGKTDATKNEQGVYYSIIKEGTGRQVLLTDTVTVFYKGYLFSDGSVFDQTKDKPATFLLNRLIKGWQLGVPLCKVGGKIKLVIPSDLAYSIRTRSAKIPPNSILVFEIEVVDAK